MDAPGRADRRFRRPRRAGRGWGIRGARHERRSDTAKGRGWRRGVHDGGRRERGDQVIQNIAGVAGAAGALAAAADGAWETELKAERLIPLHLGKRWWRP